MATLTESEKHFVVERLAQFCGHAEVARQLEMECGVVVDRWQVRTYDAAHPKFAGGDKLRELFWAKRKSFETVVEDIPIAHPAYRLNTLQKMLDEAWAKGNLPLVAKILRQAAQEVGKLRLSGRPQAEPQSPFRNMTPDERRAAVAEMLRAALGSDRVPSQKTHELPEHA